VTAIDSALPRLKTEEGFRARAYRDTEGHTTIGYGWNIDAGITPRAAAALLQAQLEELHDTLMTYAWYAGLDPVREGVCLDIAINDGLHGLLAFPNMIAALARKDWISAQSECHVQNPELQERYNALAHILLTGTQ
jgi:GH24 family phage-related lysozyme (muramidase)